MPSKTKPGKARPGRRGAGAKRRTRTGSGQPARAAPMRFVSKAPVDLAFSWLSDITEQDHSGPAFPERRRPGTAVAREILSMTPHEAVVKDTWGKRTIYTRARFHPGDRIEYEWGDSPERFRPWTVWRFDPGEGGRGCVITVEFMEGVSPGIARSSADGVRRDAERHIRQMEDGVVSMGGGPHREAVVRKDLTRR